jgi:DNA-binding NarL/FixJ family response regulator
MPATIIIYEDNDTMREGLAQLVNTLPGYEMKGAFMNCSDVEYHLLNLQPDVILMDIEMPQIDGLEGIQRIRKINSEVKIIVLTVFEDNKNVFDAVCAGANGYLLKKHVSEKLFDSITDVLEGGAPMSAGIATKVLAMLAGNKQKPLADYSITQREKEILQSLVKGNSYKMIAAELHISLQTVKTHIKNVYEKMQVHSQAEAVSKAINERLI